MATMGDIAIDKPPFWALYPKDTDCLEVYNAASDRDSWSDMDTVELLGALYSGQVVVFKMDFWNFTFSIDEFQISQFRNASIVSVAGEPKTGRYYVRISAIVENKYKWFYMRFSSPSNAVRGVNAVRKSIHVKGGFPDFLLPRWTGTLKISGRIVSSDECVTSEECINCHLYSVILDEEGLFLFNNSLDSTPAYQPFRFVGEPPEMSLETEKNVYEVTTADYTFTVFNASEHEDFITAFSSIENKPLDIFCDDMLIRKYLEPILADATAARAEPLPAPCNNVKIWDFNTREQLDLMQRELHHALDVSSSDVLEQWRTMEHSLMLQLDNADPLEDVAEGVFLSGIDPNSLDQMTDVFEQVRHHLTSERYDLAMSQIRRACAIYKTSTHPEIVQMFSEDPLELLKMLFCMSKTGEQTYNEHKRAKDTEKFLYDLTFAVDELAEDVEIGQKWSVLEVQVQSLLDNISSIEESEEDVFSSGLDPNNREHLKMAFDEIKYHMTSDRNDLALSRLRGIKTIFRNSIFKQTQCLMDIEDIDLLKMLYYKAQAEKLGIRPKMRKKNKMGWKPKQQKRLYVSSEDWNGDNVRVLSTAAFGTQKELSRPKDDCNVSNRDISNMIDQMKEAVDILSQTEDFLLPWIVAEAELKALAENHDALKDGEEEVLSGGLDPNNAEHFMRGCSQIKEDLRDQRYDLALSRWNGLRIIFRESKNKKIRQLVFSYDIDVLKKLYFHSFFEY